MTELEKNNVKKLHELLDIVLLCNGLGERKREQTGNLPTMFFRFSGHVATVYVDINMNGWKSGESADHTWCIDTDAPITEEIVEKIRGTANAALAETPSEEELLKAEIIKAEEELKRKRVDIAEKKRNLKAIQKKGA